MSTAIRAMILAACLLSQAAVARATTGGPETATILGWNPAERRIYYVVRFLDESGRPPRVFFLDLKSSQPEKAVPLSLWPEKGDRHTDYRSINSKIEALRKGLAQLSTPAPDTLALAITTRALQKEWSDAQGGVRPRYELEILVSRESLEGRAQVTTFCNREVLIKEWYEIPELPYAIVNLSYTGSPDETCYARPAVILLSAAATASTSPK